MKKKNMYVFFIYKNKDRKKREIELLGVLLY